MTATEVIVNGLIGWAVINTLLMLAFVALMWHETPPSERRERRAARQLSGWR